MDAGALEGGEFAALMARFQPFEQAPRLAVAVSGGADSLALTLLAHDWARTRGGSVVALTVDHRLRPQSAAETADVAIWLGRRKIPHHILVWQGPRPRRGLQASARSARYRLLEAWCAQNGVLHLLLGHHRGDQAETLLLRLARGSGVDGLAGMAGVVERGACRVLRPLLGVPRERLRALLQDRGQPWIEDPSNRDRAYTRVRLRELLGTLHREGLGADRLPATARHLGRARRALEAQVAALLADAALLHPAGFLRLDRGTLLAAPAEIALKALAAALTTLGGGEYPPRLERLERLYAAIVDGFADGRTLGGCRVLPAAEGLLICREPAAMADPVPAAPGAATPWDGRFRLDLGENAPSGLSLGALGAAALPFKPRLPAAVRASLPALWQRRALAAVPALGYVPDPGAEAWLAASRLVFRPNRPLSGAGFTVV